MEFVVCINNKDYPVDLQLHKIYRVISENELPDFIRILDESGEDYLYPIDYFAHIQVPEQVKKSFTELQAV
ncbi:MAG: hypothetical protein ACE5I1_29735 [bacterium]